jgi:hypothetical protein
MALVFQFAAQVDNAGQQAIDVTNYAPELWGQVFKGEMKLRDAARVARERKPAPPERTNVLLLSEPDESISEWSASQVLDFLRNLRKGITERRSAANAERHRRQWNNIAVLKHELENLLNWIETELDKLPQQLARRVAS